MSSLVLGDDASRFDIAVPIGFAVALRVHFLDD
jgi:hypothetical protein